MYGISIKNIILIEINKISELIQFYFIYYFHINLLLLYEFIITKLFYEVVNLDLNSFYIFMNLFSFR